MRAEEPEEETENKSMINMMNRDCMEFMAGVPDKYYELAIVDPPYGLGDKMVERGGAHKESTFAVLYKNSSRWDIVPDEEYFKELFRISINQIICGGNYFNLPTTRGIICWDKKQKLKTFSRWEYLWTSFDAPARVFEFSSTDLNRFHPTQKPVALYKWLLTNYAKQGDKILDTHGGSGSICIACHDMGFDIDWMELDKDYYAAAVKRYEEHAAQGQIFMPKVEQIETQAILI